MTTGSNVVVVVNDDDVMLVDPGVTPRRLPRRSSPTSKR